MLTAVISGAGQDSSYLAEYLLGKDYKVVVFSKRNGGYSYTENIRHLLGKDNFTFLNGDLSDPTFISRILIQFKPDEFYNTGALSHVGQSFKEPMQVFKTNAEAVIMQLDLVRQLSPYTRYLQCSTSEMYGGLNCPESGLDENCIFNPRSPYAIAKVAAHYAVKNYREAYDIFSCSSICFNHSSTRRPIDFATRKITHGVASIKLGLKDKLKMGNMESFRDEGCAIDYVKAMHLMLQQENPEDYVIATGAGATIREMLEFVCELAGLRIEDVYQVDTEFMRPSDVKYLLGDSTKARKQLNWYPEYTWRNLLQDMFNYDMVNLSKT